MSDILGTTNAQQQLVEKIQEATDACMESAASAIDALEKLGDHNQDALSHPDIRKAIAAAAGASTDFVDGRVDQHNTSPTAHPELLAKLTAIANDTTAVRQLIDNLIIAHDKNTTAHADIRGALNEIKLQLGTYNLPLIAQALADLQKLINGTIIPEISDLQSRIAKYDAAIQSNTAEIEAVKASMSGSSNDLLTLNKDSVKTADKLMTTTLFTAAVDTASLLGFDAYADVGPTLLDFTTTMPNQVGRNAVIEFNVGGAVGIDPAHTIKYSLTYGRGDIVLEPTTKIKAGDPIKMVVGDKDDPGDIIYFICTITDVTNGASLKRIINTMIAEEFDVERVSCYGLTTKVEPGHKYTFVIRNLSDIGDGRFSYQIDAGASGLLFDKTGILQAEEQVTMTVPSALSRDMDYVFTVVVNDKYGADKTKPVTVHTNAIPGAEGFKHNVPSFVAPNKSYDIRFSGVKSANGVPATYGISNPNSHLTFSKKTDIVANENVTMTVDGTVIRGESYGFTVVATDENGATVNIDMSVIINSLPSVETLTTTMVSSITGGRTTGLTINGGADLEAKTVTYAIDAASSGFSFSKTSGILAGETVTVTIPKVAGTIDRTFNVTVVDDLGEKSSGSKMVTVTVNPIYVPDTPFIISPQQNASVNADFSMTFSEFSMHVDI